jgi:hypothetical protein
MGLVFGKTIDELPSRHVGLPHDVYHRAIKDIKSAFNVSREVAENALKSWVQGRGSGVSDKAAEIGEFALQLVGDAASRTEIDLARAAAEAQLELARIGREKQLLLEVFMSDVSSPDIQAIRRLDRYERRAKSRRKRALSRLSQLCQLPIFR